MKQIILTVLISFGLAVVSLLYVQHLKTEMMLQFRALTQTQGAWSQDRDLVSSACGIAPKTLPSKQERAP